MTHIILFLLIPAKNPNLLDIGIEETPQHGITK
jgi:hypothetical protein